MLFQKTQMCFNEPDYVTVRSAINIRTAKGAKMVHKMPQQCFQVVILCQLMERDYKRHTITNLVVWLSCYVYILAILSYFTKDKKFFKNIFQKKITCPWKDVH